MDWHKEQKVTGAESERNENLRSSEGARGTVRRVKKGRMCSLYSAVPDSKRDSEHLKKVEGEEVGQRRKKVEVLTFSYKTLWGKRKDRKKRSDVRLVC